MVRRRGLSRSFPWIVAVGLLAVLGAPRAATQAPPAAATTEAPASVSYAQLTSESARELMQSREGRSDFVILDVRTPDEFKEGHLPGAVNLDFRAPDFERQVAKLDRDKTYLVYCRSGRRSAAALEVFARLGFRQVNNLQKGLLEWREKGYPVVQ